jgi:hypothetical protein
MAHSQYEPGNYVAAITSQGIGKSEKKGTPYLRLMIRPLVIVQGRTETDVQFLGEREISLWLTQNSADIAVETLVKLGYPHNSFDQFDPAHPNCYSFKGQQINVYMKLESYQTKDGKEQFGEKWAVSQNQGERKKFEPMAKAEVSKLNQFAGAFKSKRAELGVTQAPARKPAVTVPNNSTFTDDAETI